MSTRSDIIVHRADDQWVRIYCHWDGYLEGVGKTLHEHYDSQERAEELVSQGDISSLGPRCDKPEGHSFGSPAEGCTVYYGRDRGETETMGKVGPSLQTVWPPAPTWTEFTYVWDYGQWWVGDPDEGTQTLVPLKDALEGKRPVTPHVKWPFVGTIGRHKPLKS